MTDSTEATQRDVKLLAGVFACAIIGVWLFSGDAPPQRPNPYADKNCAELTKLRLDTSQDFRAIRRGPNTKGTREMMNALLPRFEDAIDAYVANGCGPE